MVSFVELMQRSDAQIMFEGLGPYDVFNIKSKRTYYIGMVICDMDNPPFESSNHRDFEYAYGYVIFPKGVIVLSGQVGKPQKRTKTARR